MPQHDNTDHTDATTPVPVAHNEAEHQFEIRFPEGVALLRYRQRADGAFVLIHTEVPPALRGRGLADRLARAALDYARDHQLAVVPLCPFVKAYIERHPEFQSLVRTGG